MKRLISGLSLAIAFCGGATAQESVPAAPAIGVQDSTPASSAGGTLTFNVAAVSDYRYRGISQTRRRPALQGGADWTGPDGWYAGAWLSTIRWTRDAGGDGAIEVDLYGGKRGDLGAGLTYDAGVLGYAYPSNGLDPSANTLELYSQIGRGPFAVKYSHATTNLFGFADSRRSGYLDAALNQDMGGGWTVNLHAGRQRVRNHGNASYTDWKAGVTKDFGIVTFAIAYIGTNADETAYASPANGKFTGRDAVVVTVAKVF